MAKDSDIIRSELPLRIIELKESVLEDNNKDAQELRETLRSRKTCLINLMSGPGSGKTSTLLALQPYLEGRIRWGVMEADIDSDVDAKTLLHLDLVVLENIGNLVCPAEFDTGAAVNMTILSVPEGDDKPAKYPLMYEACDLMVINKIDAMAVFDFDKEKVERYAKLRNPDIRIFYISAKTGEGVAALAEEILAQVTKWNA